MAKQPPCLVCVLSENEENEDPFRVIARAIAYGSIVLAKAGQGISTCSVCHEAIAEAERELKAEMRRAKRDAREAGERPGLTRARSSTALARR
jgi:hypothetical protein